ncbi:MAG TPA: 50S ribosomal protein L18 [Firmicutes bacterium]|nr:50S ribosomal protein L18 [Candidatus Fermentithermobacillaceae bacterium]
MAWKTKHEKRKRRHLRVRKRVIGTPERPRLSVFRSQKHIYAQVIDDSVGHTLVAASSLEPLFRQEDVSGSNVEGAARVGKLLAERALQKGITKVVFDRGGYLYHGRVKALAEAAREGGLDF